MANGVAGSDSKKIGPHRCVWNYVPFARSGYTGDFVAMNYHNYGLRLQLSLVKQPDRTTAP